MPKQALNLLSENKIKSFRPKDADYKKSDGGGLYIRIRKHGTVEWLFRYTSPLTQTRRTITIGSYKDFPTSQARKKASQYRQMVQDNLDPLVEEEKSKIQERKRLKAAEAKKADTVENNFYDWKRFDLQNRKDNGHEIERAFKKDVFPVIAQISIFDIERNDIMKILRRPLDRGSKRLANQLLSHLKQYFGFLQDEKGLLHDPTNRIMKRRVGGIEKPRERYLNEKERKALSVALLKTDIAPKYQHAIWILLGTLFRIDELSSAKWDQIDFDKKQFFLPDTKNQTSHNIHLSNFVIKHLQQLESINSSDWLFPSPSGNAPIHRQTINKQIADRQKESPISGRTKLSDSLLIGERWTAHDLRRTGATIMQELGILPHIIERCQNHKEQNSMIATYQRSQLNEQQKEAFDLLGGYLKKIEN